MIELFVNDEKINCLEIEVNKSLSTCAGTFMIVFGGGKIAHKKNDKVKITANSEIVINGKIEYISANMDSGTNRIIYMGRDNTGDFIDSYFDRVMEFNRSLKLEKIISEIVKQFDLTVTTEIKVPNFTTSEMPTARVGENMFSFCDKLCAIRGVILTASNDGNILITDEGVNINDEPLIFKENYGNIIARNYECDYTKQYDSYVVLSQNNSTLDTRNNLVNSNGIDGKGTRVKSFFENNSLSIKECQNRAKFERDLDIRRSIKYAAKLNYIAKYKINERVKLQDEYLGIDEEMLINSIEYIYSANESSTTIILEKMP